MDNHTHTQAKVSYDTLGLSHTTAPIAVSPSLARSTVSRFQLPTPPSKKRSLKVHATMQAMRIGLQSTGTLSKEDFTKQEQQGSLIAVLPQSPPWQRGFLRHGKFPYTTARPPFLKL